MKNLYFTNAINYKLDTDRKVEKFCVDSKLNDIYFYGDGILSKVTVQNGKETNNADLMEYYQSKEKIPKIIGMNYLESSEAICFIFINGDILLYGTATSDIQCVGIVSTGVKAMAWSPDEEIITLVTGEDNLIVMTSSFDPVNEIFLNENNKGEKQFITAGWGKKETQFHGSEGKAAAKVMSQPCKPVFDWDDLQPHISWRGDGELFVVSAVNSELKHRQLKIFNREGVLQCISEPVDGLEAPVCWRPSGALIASVQRLPNKYMIVFFEKNGLRHGEFNLPFEPDEMMVKDLSWNSDSTLLAVWSENLKTDGNVYGFLQLWAVNNYHWYLKYVLNYNPYGRFVSFFWDINHRYRIHMLCDNATYASHDYQWTVDHSKGKTEEDSSYIAVVDGDKLLLTPFRQTVVPPPMSAYTIHLPLPISNVVFAPPLMSNIANEIDNCKEDVQNQKSSTNDFFVVLTDSSVILFSECEEMVGEYKMTDGTAIRLTKVGSDGYKSTTKYHNPCRRFTLDWSNVMEELGEDIKNATLLRHWHWISKSTIFACFANGLDTAFCFIDMCLSSSDGSDVGKLSVRSTNSLLGSVVTLAVSYSGDKSSAIMQLQDGTLMKYAFSTGCISNFVKSNGQPMNSLPVFIKMEVCSIDGEEYIFALTNKNKFYVNDAEVLSDCSSFFVHSEYLLITTYRHTLMNILLQKKSIVHFVTKKWDSNGIATENIRRVERGSRLVVAVPKHSKVVLQMPRGNLECIQPRALSLHIIADLVKRRQYGRAFELIRTQRINLNFLCDVNPQDFIKNLKEFVIQVNNANWISLFICELQPENVLEIMYTGMHYLEMNQEKEKLKNKLSTVCDELRKAMESIDEVTYFLPILTTYVMKRTNEDLVLALKKVQSIKGHTSTNGISSDEALKYLIYLVDVDALYDAALRIYDFDLVMMIAAKSSKDPKEYIPFINDLQKLETNYQHYKIDMHLKSYSSALRSIAKCGEEHFDECLSLIRSHNLYVESLKLFPKGSTFHRQICDAYADHLIEKRQYEEAGIMQKLSNQLEKALVSFKNAGNWRQTLILAKELQYNQSQMAQLCREISNELKEKRKFSDAAFILNEYLRDHEECVESLTNGCLWEEAIRVAHHCNRLDLIETHVKPGIKEHSDNLISRLNTNNDLFMKYKTRLLVLREEKLKAKQELEEKGEDTNIGEDDLVSEASSVLGSAVGSSFHSSSRGSSRSSKSSKNRRKQERKYLSLKEGNPYEEMALMNALKNLYESTFSQEIKDEVRGLSIVLIQYGHEDLACQIQEILNSLQKEMHRSRDEIWLIHHTEEQMHFGPLSTSNVISAMATTHSIPKSPYHALDPVYIPPVTKDDSSWKLNILVPS